MVGETPPYPHVCFIGSDRIIPLVHIINRSLLSPYRKHLVFFASSAIFTGGFVVVFFLFGKVKKNLKNTKYEKIF